jgi:hypothetical protein
MTFLKTFLLTYTTFTTAEKLLHKLIERCGTRCHYHCTMARSHVRCVLRVDVCRYHVPQDRKPPNTRPEDWNTTTLMPIRLRVWPFLRR